MRGLSSIFLALFCSTLSASPLAIPVDGSWHLQLDGTLQTPDRQVYDIDLYDTPTSTITTLKAQGRIVICYFSAGTWEDWREDASQYPDAAKGKALDDWAGERWLDIRRQDVRNLLAKRLDLAVSKGCDGVDPDNVDGYSNDNGLNLTQGEQLSFARWMAKHAHLRNLSVGLKNAIELLPYVADDYDFAVNESCYQYKECDVYKTLRSQGKPVFIAEYRSYNASMCAQAAASGYNLQFFKTSLKAVGEPCK